MHLGSSELAALPPWPGEVPVLAIAGHTNVRGLSMFGAKVSDDVDVGDVIVDPLSATDGSTSQHGVTCRYDLIARRYLGGLTMKALRLESSATSAGNVIQMFTTNPCFHSNLMRTVNAVSLALRAAQDAAGSPIPLHLRGDDGSLERAAASWFIIGDGFGPFRIGDNIDDVLARFPNLAFESIADCHWAYRLDIGSSKGGLGILSD